MRVDRPCPAHWLSQVLAAPLSRAVVWYKIAAERRNLAELSRDRLSDIGISRERLRGELTRSFWDVRRDV